MSKMLQGKVAIITGAGRGLGKEFALKYAEEGARLFLPDISLERSEQTAKEIRANSGEAFALETDVSQEVATQKMAEKAMEKYGKIDILVNNAAIWYGLNAAPWDTWKKEDWDRILAVNVTGSWLCCKAVVPHMLKAGKGKIINVASNVARVPAAAYFLPYSCSKGAVYTLTHALAKNLGASGINVNAIAPGYTASEASLGQTGSDQTFQLATSEQSIKRRLQPRDIIGTAVFLASEASDMITGQVIYVDGGTVTL